MASDANLLLRILCRRNALVVAAYVAEVALCLVVLEVEGTVAVVLDEVDVLGIFGTWRVGLYPAVLE